MTAYYTASGNPPAATKGLSASMRAEFVLIQTGLASAQTDITTNNAAQTVAVNARLRGLAAVFTSSGTWTCPAGVTLAKITVTGSGASGGTSSTTASVAGAAGGTSIKWATVTPGAAYTVTIGAGGVASGAGSNSTGASGNASSIVGTGVNVAGNGGAGNAGAGGTGSGGDLTIKGGDSVAAVGSSPMSGAASFISTNSTGVGQYGGGGAGVTVGLAGNNGGAGLVIIEY